MIGKISGTLDYRGGDHVLIDTGGVGYLVHCSERTLAAMPARGGLVSLYTEMVVREDLLQLYGFPTLAEREWHRLLTSVQGVGAKAALAVLGTLGPEGTGRAIALGDAAAVRAAPGIGPKIAQRITHELRDKAPAVMALGADGAQMAKSGFAVTERPGAQAAAQQAAGGQAAGAAAQADALSALVNLGYGQGEAAGGVAEAAGGGAGLAGAGV
ncbi:MAG: Holliday junction branch migration protein RuvA, partial [Paracoccaceae bacterium]